MDVIERLIADHCQVQEHSHISQKLAELINNDAFFWDNAVQVSRFFNKEVKEHFAIEEKVLFVVLRKMLNKEMIEHLDKIEKEHAAINAKLNELDLMSLEHTKYPSKATRESFVKTCSEVLELLLPHAKIEDQILFQFIKGNFKNEQYKELESLYFKYMGV